jgi:hypothetical protein
MLKKISTLLLMAILATNGFCADLIINEFNAVGQEKYLETADYASSTSVDLYFQSIADGNHPDKITGSLPNGRIQGNGSDWIELVVVKDHLDIRGWQIRWAETDTANAPEANGSNIWYGNGNVEQGILTFSNNAVWSNLRAGTIITVVEENFIYVDTANGNLTYNVGPGHGATINVDTDTSFNPAIGDWWINVSVRGEAGRPNPLITSVHNVLGHQSWDFGVGNANWQGQINTAGGTLVWGPVGEAVSGGWGGGGVNSSEIGRLEVDPSASATGANFDDAHSSSFGMPNRYGTPVEVSQSFMSLRSWYAPPADCAAAISMGFGNAYDFNHDCYVNFADFAYFAQNWLSCIKPGDPKCSTPWLD